MSLILLSAIRRKLDKVTIEKVTLTGFKLIFFTVNQLANDRQIVFFNVYTNFVTGKYVEYLKGF